MYKSLKTMNLFWYNTDPLGGFEQSKTRHKIRLLTDLQLDKELSHGHIYKQLNVRKVKLLYSDS